MFQRKTRVTQIKRIENVGYKYGLKGYNLWNPKTEKAVYSQDVVSIEIKDVLKHEVLQKEEEHEKIEFELKENESYSREEKKL